MTLGRIGFIVWTAFIPLEIFMTWLRMGPDYEALKTKNAYTWECAGGDCGKGVTPAQLLSWRNRHPPIDSLGHWPGRLGIK